MKPRVVKSHGLWQVQLPDRRNTLRFTWQAAMKAANRWVNERYLIGRDLFGFFRVFAYDDNGDLCHVAVGQDRHDACRNAARTLPTGNQTNDRRTP